MCQIERSILSSKQTSSKIQRSKLNLLSTKKLLQKDLNACPNNDKTEQKTTLKINFTWQIVLYSVITFLIWCEQTLFFLVEDVFRQHSFCSWCRCCSERGK